jgi:hypothetical protein
MVTAKLPRNGFVIDGLQAVDSAFVCNLPTRKYHSK